MLAPDTLAEFLATPKSLVEVNRRSRERVAREQLLDSKALPGNYGLFEQKNSQGDSVFAAIPQTSFVREWAVWQAKREPYLWVQFPVTCKHTSIQLSPLSDVHYGAKAHSLRRFKQYLKWIENTPNVFTFLNGDIIENAIDGSIGGAVYESLMSPEEQIWGSEDGKHEGIIALLRPIAHKIFFALRGNHEDRTVKKTSIDPIRIICDALQVPYFSEPVYADILAWGQRFTIYAHHGTGGGGTKGGKLNGAARPAEFQESVNAVFMGHVHDSAINQTTRIVRKRFYGQNHQLTRFKLEEKVQYVCILPSFYSYWQTYASRSGYAPGSWGSINLTLYADGSYRASE